MNVKPASETRIELRIYRDDEIKFSTVIDKPLEIGRQRFPAETQFCRIFGRRADRIVVAPVKDARVSRSQLLIEPNDDFSVWLTNTSQTRIIALENDLELMPGEQVITGDVCLKLDELPIHIRIPDWRKAEFFRVRGPNSDERKIETKLEVCAVNLRHQSPSLPRLNQTLGLQTKDDLIECLEQFSNACGNQIGSPERRNAMLRSLTDIADFDFVAVYEPSKQPWEQVASDGSPSANQLGIDREFGLRVLRENCVIVANARSSNAIDQMSCIGFPLVDSHTGKIAVLYAERRGGLREPISPFEAAFTAFLTRIGWSLEADSQRHPIARKKSAPKPCPVFFFDSDLLVDPNNSHLRNDSRT